MNAPVVTSHPRKAYAPAVLQALPDCQGRALATRCQLMLERDEAARTIARADATDMEKWVAGQVLYHASVTAVRPMSDERLGFAILHIGRMASFMRGLDCQDARMLWDDLDRDMRIVEAAFDPPTAACFPERPGRAS